MRKNCHLPTYYSWRALRDRCNRKKNASYKYYGGEGIGYDPRWESYDAFLEDMGERPEGKTIDRIDTTKGYFKENCRWSTAAVQVRNRRFCLQITYNGVTKTSAEWARDLGLTKGAVWNRIKLCGWSVEKAVTTPKEVAAYQL